MCRDIAVCCIVAATVAGEDDDCLHEDRTSIGSHWGGMYGCAAYYPVPRTKRYSETYMSR